MIYIKNIIKICFVIIGTVVGAGFASGKEIFSFFCIYGIYGFYGILISNFLIGLVIYLTFIFVYKNKIKSYSEFIKLLVDKNNLLNYIINNIMNIFLLVSFVVMIAGFGTYFYQEFNLPKIIGSFIISIFAFLTFFKNINGIIKINSYLIPFLIVLIVFLGFKCNIFYFDCNSLIKPFGINWLVKSILYSSYNSIVLIPIIINLTRFIVNKKQIKQITFFTVFFMLIMSIIILIILSMNTLKISIIDIPVVYIASELRFYF